MLARTLPPHLSPLPPGRGGASGCASSFPLWKRGVWGDLNDVMGCASPVLRLLGGCGSLQPFYLKFIIEQLVDLQASVGKPENFLYTADSVRVVVCYRVGRSSLWAVFFHQAVDL